MTEVTDVKAQGLANGSTEAKIKPAVVKHAESTASQSSNNERNDVPGTPSPLKNGDIIAKSQKGKNPKSNTKSAAKSRLKEIDKSETPLPAEENMGCNNTRAVIEPSSLTKDKKTVDNCGSEGGTSDEPGTSTESKNIPDCYSMSTNKADTNESDSVFCDQHVQGESISSDSGVNRSRNTSRTSESTNSDTEKCVAPSESASESTEKVVTRGLESSDVTDVEETADDGNVESSGIEGGVHNRPHSLSLPRPLQHHERRHKGARNFVHDDTSSDDQVSVDSDISSFGSSLHGMITRKGDMIEFVTDNLQEKIRGSRDSSSMGSRTSSMRSISSVNSISSYTSSLATSVSGMSRSPSSLVQQSPDAAPPIDPQAVQDLEAKARIVADCVDLMMGNLKANLFKMSAITVGTLDAYKHSVESTCEAVDASIKSMYALMAKCEELSMTVKPVYQLADQIKEIKRLLDLFENQMDAKS